MTAPHSNLRRLTKALARVRGGLVLGEALRRAIRHMGEPVSITDFDGDLRMVLDLTEHMQNRIFWYGYYSLDLVPLMKRVLRAGDVVFDCGANVGELTLVAAKIVGEAGRVFSFEPLPEIADQLQANVEANACRNVNVIRKGVAGEAGRAPIYQAADKSEDGLWNRGLGTLYANDQRRSLAATIELTSLDRFVGERRLRKVDLIKIDIEGGELPALHGARHLLATLRPRLIVELNQQMCEMAGYSMRELFGFLTSMNYSVSRVGRRGEIHSITEEDLRPFQNLYCEHQK